MALPSVVDEIERLFEELIHRRWGGAGRQLVPAEVLPVADGWIIKLAVEGLRAEDVTVEVHGQQLSVVGQRRQAQARRGQRGWMHTEQETTVRRTLPLPADADPGSVEAQLEGSTLSIHVRRRQR